MGSSYEEMTWRERAEAFLTDGRNTLGQSQALLEAAVQPSMNGKLIVGDPNAGIYLAQANIVAVMSQAYMLGAQVCMSMHTAIPETDWGVNETEDTEEYPTWLDEELSEV